MWAWFEAGGPVMWPLLACSVIALTVVLERLVFWARLDVARDTQSLEWLLEEYGAGGPKADPPPGAKKGAVYAMLLSGIAHQEFSCAKAMEARALDEAKRMRRGMRLLDTIITVAPMLGILGTVSGIITSFDMLGQAGVEEPKAVIAGIAEALITTATGLTISIAVVFPYNWFNALTEDALSAFEHYGTRLEMIHERLHPQTREAD